MKRIAVFSDVHANLPAMEAVRDHIEAHGYDAIYCLGDIGGYASQPNEVQRLIMQMGCPTVTGNYDENVGFDGDNCGCGHVAAPDIELGNISFFWTREHTTDENKAWLRALPRSIHAEIGGLRVLFLHGHASVAEGCSLDAASEGYFDQLAALGKANSRADVVVFGHTHLSFHRLVDGVHLVNTGSVGRPKDGDPRAGYCALSITDGQVTAEQIRVTYDVEAACCRLIEAGLPPYFADYLRNGGPVACGAGETSCSCCSASTPAGPGE